MESWQNWCEILEYRLGRQGLLPIITPRIQHFWNFHHHVLYTCVLYVPRHSLSPAPDKTSKISDRIKDVKGVGDFIWSESWSKCLIIKRKRILFLIDWYSWSFESKNRWINFIWYLNLYKGEGRLRRQCWWVIVFLVVFPKLHGPVCSLLALSFVEPRSIF